MPEEEPAKRILSIVQSVRALKDELTGKTDTEVEVEEVPVPLPIAPPATLIPETRSHSQSLFRILFDFSMIWCGYCGVFVSYGAILHWANTIAWLKFVSQVLYCLTFSPLTIGFGGIILFIRYQFFRPNQGRIEALIQASTAYTAAIGILSLIGFKT